MFGSLSASDFAVISQNMYLPYMLWYLVPGINFQLSNVKHPICLLRKQLHLPYSNDLPGRPRGVYPKKMVGRAFTVWPGAFFVFFIFDGGRLLRILPVFAKSMALNKIEAFTRITAVRRAMWGGLRPSRVRRVTVIRRLR